MDFITQSDRQIINRINEILGESHRDRPYNLKNTDDLIEATKMKSAELVDMYQCFTLIGDTIEIFDESMEYFHTASWVDPDARCDNTYIDALACMYELEEILMTIMSDLRNTCKILWNEVLNDPNCSKSFFDCSVIADSKDMEEMMKYINDNLEVICYTGYLNDSVNGIVQLIDSWIKY